MTSACKRLAKIIGGTAQETNGVCVVSRLRNINAKILNRRTHSPLALPLSRVILI